MKVIKEYSRDIIHLMDSEYSKLEDYDKQNREINIKNKMKPIVLVNTSWFFKCDILEKHILNYSDYYEIIILANTVEEQQLYKDKFNNIECLFINHNTFTNENNFFINENVEKKFDLVVNSAFSNYKRLHLTKLINNTVYIGRYYDDFLYTNLNENSIILNFKDNNFIKDNYKWLCHNDINTISNQSFMGGIFSNIEGACFSSSQYLLCGLPVISTRCKGGREIWYNDKNSIYCDDTPESVLACVEIVKQKIKNGEFNKYQIRETHIENQEFYRIKLTNYILQKIEMKYKNEKIDFEYLKKQLSYFVW